MGDRILMKLDIYKDLMSQIIHFKFGFDPRHYGVERVTGNIGNQESLKTLRVERSG